jgi:membrane-bound lytic murein transglycosylase D
MFRMRVRRRAVIVTVSIASLALSHAVRAHASAADFPVPPSLRVAITFWKNVFGKYSEHQILIHDTEHLGRVYAVLDYRDLAARGESAFTLEQVERAGMAAEKERIRDLLLALDARAGNDAGLTDEEQRIWNLFAKNPSPGKFAAAADPSRIRAQRGLRERFAEGVRVSRRYLGEMEEIFRSEGLPVELTRLPLVESCFNIEAYSKVGAAGIWQFMRSTGRTYMQIGGVLDERRDPLRATRAAAQHLGANFETLGSWPLAITAYNHGCAGIARAVSDTGTTDIGTIVRRYHGALFGFASRNFYAEFLAALAVESSADRYFGPLEFDAPFRGEEVRLEHALAGKIAASCAATTPQELAVLNPAIDSAVFVGRGNIPRGYLLRVPPGSAGQFAQRLAQIASDARVVAVPEGRARATRTAKRSGGAPSKQKSTRTAAAARAKRASTSTAAAPAKAESSSATATDVAYRTHRVGKGQTLSHIARQYRVSVQRLKGFNSLHKSDVKPGQVLRIPTG